MKLRNTVETKILKLNKRAEKAKKLLQALYSEPFIDYNDVCRILNITARPANELIKSFEKLGILNEITGYKRNKLYTFNSYIEIFLK